MGYTTKFEGALKIVGDPTLSMIKELKKFLGEDTRDHEEWGDAGDCYYIQYELTEEMDGIKWDGSEKFYGAVDAVNIITRNMRKTFPDFAFSGELLAQGEDLPDRWRLVMKDGVATHVDHPHAGKIVQCPDCGHEFELDDKS